ncbi:MAG TPA: hypothetical protein VG325_07650 [Solirubrobacteraceae bacterium]|jgi:hypothetical protein|nr:hypothetical protein [Solirubrobacteraceae bacterium]
MGRTWVLDTETKGTGAHMVPLERATTRSSEVEPVFVPRKPLRPREPQAATPRTPRRFRIVDVMTRQTLVDGSDAREAVDVLRGVRSLVDVEVYTWDEERARWRLLAVSEQRAMWEFARS